jgi:hypothetical protein
MKCLHQLGPPNAIRAACPKCGAVIGMACSSPAKVQVPPHKDRRLAYRKLVAETPERKPL